MAFHYMTPQEMIRIDKAFELHKNILEWLGKKTNNHFQKRFRDLARIFLMLEDIEFDTSEYQKYMNFSTF